MKHKRKPHLAGIHEFSAVAYVKGLKAGNLDVYTLLRHFVGYDSESKGFSIYWPRAQSVTVEENVVFNDSDATVNATAVIPSDLSEGEKEKIIQILKNNTRHTEANVIENPLTNVILKTISIHQWTPNHKLLYLCHMHQIFLQEPIANEPDEELSLGCGQCA
jgi:hypothetical protein